MKFKRIISIILVLCFMFAFTSCSKNDGMNYLFRYAIPSDPKNLDPQLATDESSLVVIENLYEGLMKKAEDGKIVNGVAESYSISDDGLTLTFNLKNNYYWVGLNDVKYKLTANDFVFSFRRLVNPKTYSPYAEKYFSIKNARQINSGEMPVENLGVRAEDDYTLIIELDYPNPEFLNLLAETSSMPCNEEYFYSTKGKYGLEAESVIANGPFYLYKWINDPYGKDNYLILRRSEEYNKISKVCPSGLNFFVVKDEAKRIEGFKDGDYDFIVDNGSNKSLYEEDNKSEKYTIKSGGIIFNLNNQIMKNDGVRQALAISLNRNISDSEFKRGIEPAYGIVPSAVTILNKSFRELSSEPANSMYNKSLAQYLWTSSLSQSEKNLLNSATIIVPKSFEDYKYIDLYLKQWEETLEFYCSVEVLSDEDYLKRIESGNYYMAFCDLGSKTNSPEEFLSFFRTGYSNNIYKFSDSEYDKILGSINTTHKLSECVEIYSQAERYLIENYIYMPLFYNSEYLIFNKSIDGVLYDPFTKQLEFSNSKKF